ncbi:hypothetical protein D3C81_1728620 [compost metagenome]
MRPLKTCEMGSPSSKFSRLSSALTLLPLALTPCACRALARVIRLLSGLCVDQLLPTDRLVLVDRLQSSLRSKVVADAGPASTASTASARGCGRVWPSRVSRWRTGAVAERFFIIIRLRSGLLSSDTVPKCQA